MLVLPIAAEGWKWIEVAIEFPYGHAHGLRRLDRVSAGATLEDEAKIEALKAEYEALEDEYAEVPDQLFQFVLVSCGDRDPFDLAHPRRPARPRRPLK